MFLVSIYFIYYKLHIFKKYKTDTFFKKHFFKEQRIFNGFIRNNKKFASAVIQHIEKHHNRCHKIHGSQECASVFIGKERISFVINGFYAFFNISVFVKHTLGISGRSGSINGVCGIVIIRLLMTIKRFAF